MRVFGFWFAGSVYVLDFGVVDVGVVDSAAE